jgi:hypothetical protein
MITLQALMAWRQESTYTAPTDWVVASLEKKSRQLLWLATVMRYYILPAARQARYRQENRLARLRAYVLDFDQVGCSLVSKFLVSPCVFPRLRGELN